MSKYKQLSLLLCSLLIFCVGFLLIDSEVYAFTASDNFYPLDAYEAELVVENTSGTTIYRAITPIDRSNNSFTFNNDILTDIRIMAFFHRPGSVYPFVSNLYDYYLVGAVTADNASDLDSTFKPTDIFPVGWDVNTSTNVVYPRYDTNIYNIDTNFRKGFGFSQRIDFESLNNYGIYRINFVEDKDNSRSKPANLTFEFGILAVEKGTSESIVLSQILEQLVNMESSISDAIIDSSGNITDAIGAVGDKVSEIIENQYEMSESEDFGVDQIQDQVEEKLGVLNFGADTLVGFLDLFSLDHAGDTTITFPSFSINVDGTRYTVWNDIEFNLSFLEQNFGILIAAVRTITVLCVWLAVLGYLVKAKDQIIVNRG